MHLIQIHLNIYFAINNKITSTSNLEPCIYINVNNILIVILCGVTVFDFTRVHRSGIKIPALYVKDDDSSGEVAIIEEVSLSIWLDDVDCKGIESSLLVCSHSLFGFHNSHHKEDVIIRCKL